HHFVLSRSLFLLILFFFLDTAPTEIYTLSLHDALPILDDVDQYQRIVEFLNQIQPNLVSRVRLYRREEPIFDEFGIEPEIGSSRSEEHTSELQSLAYLVCRLLLEKKKIQTGHDAIHQRL